MATLKNRFITALSASERRGREAEDEYLRRAREYDPTAAVTTAAQGAWAQIAPQLQDTIRDLRGRLASSYRLRGGYGEMDEDEVFTRAAQNLTSEIARNAMSAANLELSNIQGIGGYGERVTNRYLDLLSGGLDREQMAENARRRRRGGIGALVGTGIGAAVGSFIPGVGTMLGARLGGLLGGTAGEVF